MKAQIKAAFGVLAAVIVITVFVRSSILYQGKTDNICKIIFVTLDILCKLNLKFYYKLAFSDTPQVYVF